MLSGVSEFNFPCRALSVPAGMRAGTHVNLLQCKVHGRFECAAPRTLRHTSHTIWENVPPYLEAVMPDGVCRVIRKPQSTARHCLASACAVCCAWYRFEETMSRQLAVLGDCRYSSSAAAPCSSLTRWNADWAKVTKSERGVLVPERRHTRALTHNIDLPLADDVERHVDLVLESTREIACGPPMSEEHDFVGHRGISAFGLFAVFIPIMYVLSSYELQQDAAKCRGPDRKPRRCTCHLVFQRFSISSEVDC